MKYIDYCVCCDSTNIKKFKGYMDQFVIDRMLDLPRAGTFPSDCSLVHCLDCEYIGSELRFERSEEATYYFQYADDHYIKHRSQYDGDGIANTFRTYNSKEYKIKRRNTIASVLAKHLDMSTINSVVDFGGNTGEMIPEELAHAVRYVVETDPRVFPSGITYIKTPEESGPTDLIICAHTLEHVSYPSKIFAELIKYVKTNGWIYIEVPDESPDVPVDGHVFHEHINLFNINSLRNLMIKHGIEIVSESNLYDPPQAGDLLSIAILGKLK